MKQIQHATLQTIMPVYKRSEAATQSCSLEKVFWKDAANLQENTHAEARFQ